MIARKIERYKYQHSLMFEIRIFMKKIISILTVFLIGFGINCIAQGVVTRQPQQSSRTGKSNGAMSWRKKYDFVEKQENGRFFVCKNEKWGIVSNTNHNIEVFPCRFSKIGNKDGDYQFVYDNTKCGLLRTCYWDIKHNLHEYEIVLEPIYKGIKIPYSHWGADFFFVLTEDNHVKALHVSNGLKSIILDDFIGFDEIFLEHIVFDYSRNHKVCCFRINNKWGLIGDGISKFMRFGYDYVSIQKHGIILAINNKYGFIDFNENIILDFKYQTIVTSRTHNNNIYFPTIQNDYYGMIDITGAIIIPFDYQYLEWESGDEKHILAKKDGKYGFIDINNQITIPFKFEWATRFRYNGRGLPTATVKDLENSPYYEINESGEIID